MTNEEYRLRPPLHGHCRCSRRASFKEATMPLRHIDSANLEYYLVLLDKDGRERTEQDGTLLSEQLIKAARDGVTDVFFASHGWMGDIPAAIRQYDAWIGAMAAQTDDRAQARALDPGFKAVIVGIHWPSLPWGNENAAAGLLGADEIDELAAERQMPHSELVRRYAARIADTGEAKTALTTILAAADDGDVGAQLAQGNLPPDLKRAYQVLFREAGLGTGGSAAAPGSDQKIFDPALTIRLWMAATSGQAQTGPAGQPGLLAGKFGHSIKDTLLSPVRQLSFWQMKHRACRVGETGVHALLTGLQESAPTARFHLMGHSFGCIVACAAISGPLDQGTIATRLPSPVHSLFLVQGAMSLWSFATSIPFPPNSPGYFQPIDVAPTLVGGPTVTTRSTFDRAVGTFYPLGAELANEMLLEKQQLPEFGGIGAFGIQGTATTTHDMQILKADADYGLEAGHLYNIDASTVICHGGWPSGAHSDIAHPQVAHLFWQAALSR
jgi:hypothetical protein